MLRILTSLAIAIVISAIPSYAEKYVVYAVHGPVFECERQNRTPINQRDTHLNDNSLISIGKGGSLTLFLSESRKLANISEIGMQRLSTLIKRSTKSDGASVKWVSSLLSSLMRSETPENTHRRILQSQGASHRGEDDELAAANAVAAYLDGKSQSTIPPLSVEYLSADGLRLSGDITTYDDDVTAEVTNSSDNYLFINIVAITPDGERELLFPVDTDIDNNCCAHLIIAPHTSVCLSELAFFPSLLPRGTRFLLVGSPSQINFTALCMPMQYDRTKDTLPLFFAE